MQAEQTLDFDIPAGTYGSEQLVTKLNSMLEDQYPALKNKLVFSLSGSRLMLSADGLDGSDIYRISAKSSASAYSKLIYGNVLSSSASVVNGRENSATSYSDYVPGTGRLNVSSTAGSTLQSYSYDSYTPTSSSQKTGEYLTYTYSKPTVEDGTARPGADAGQGNIQDPSTYIKTPATATFKDAMTQFTADGQSIRDISVSFKMSDSTGTMQSYSATIAKGSTAAQAIQQLNQQFGGKITASYSGGDLILTSVEKGSNIKFDNAFSGNLAYSAVKNASSSDSLIDRDANKVYTPAKLTLQYAGTNFPLTVDGNTDKLKFTAGGKTYNLTLTHKSYNSLSDFASEVNNLISASDGGSPMVTVSASGNSLVFTGSPKKTGNISISSGTTCRINQKKTNNNISSSPYYDAATGTAKVPSSIRSEGAGTHFPLTVNSSNNTITMNYTYPDTSGTKTEQLTITVADGTYNTAEQFTAAVNQAIASNPSLNGKITASYSASGSEKGLTFKTVNGGSGYKLSNLGGTSMIHKYKVKNSTSGGTVDSSGNIKFPAYINNNYFGTIFNNGGVEITDYNDTVSIKVNGTDYKFKLTHGDYTGSTGKASIISQLNTGLASAGVSITNNGNILEITTTAVGSSATIAINADNTSPIFSRATYSNSPYTYSRVYTPCQIIGSRKIDTIEIGEHCNDMEFTLNENGTSQVVNIEIAAGTYTASTLATALQDAINAKTAAGLLKVDVSGGKLRITGDSVTDSREISGFSGRLFDRVFQSASYSNIKEHSEMVGTTLGTAASYIIGRNLMEPETEEEIESGKNVVIYTGLNDQLKFDMTYKGTTYTVDIRIPEGAYTPEEIAAQIQESGRKFLKENPIADPAFDPDYFHTSIGLGEVGIEENENVAIKSPGMLVLSYIIPDNGTVKNSDMVIDGVRGNAAYKLFYSATESPRPTRLVGKADLSNGIDIRQGVNDVFSVELDSAVSTVTIEEGSYTCSELAAYLNKCYEQQGSIVRTKEYEGHLMFYTIEDAASSFLEISQVMLLTTYSTSPSSVTMILK